MIHFAKKKAALDKSGQPLFKFFVSVYFFLLLLKIIPVPIAANPIIDAIRGTGTEAALRIA